MTVFKRKGANYGGIGHTIVFVSNNFRYKLDLSPS